MTDTWLDDAVQQQIDTERQQLRASSIATPKTSPDVAASAWKDGKDQGLAPGVSIAHHESVQAEASRKRLDLLAQSQPAVTMWLSAKPENMAVAHDDVQGLSSVADSVQRPQLSFWDRLKLHLEGSSGTALGGVVQLAADKAKQTLEWQNLLDRQIYGIDNPLYTQAGKVAKAGGSYAEYGKSTQELAGSGIDRPSSVSDAFKRPGNAAKYYTGIVADSLFPMLMAAAARNPELAAGAFGTTAAGQAYSEAKSQGESDAQAQKLALDQFLIGAGFSEMPFFKAFSGGKLLPRMAKTSLASSVSMGGMASASLQSQQAEAGKRVSASEAFANVMDSMVVGASMGPAAALAGAHSTEDLKLKDASAKAERVVQSAQDVDHLAAMHKAAADSKTLKRIPEEAQHLIRQIVDNTPDAPTHVYFNGDEIKRYFQSANLDPEAEVANLTGDPGSLGAATASGGDIAVPMERYLTKVPQSPHADALLDIARLAPDRASNAELRSLDTKDLFSPESTDSTVESVQKDVQAQLEQAGVEKSAAADQARLIAQRYATRAERRNLGESAADVYKASGLSIRAGEGRPEDVSRALMQGPKYSPEELDFFVKEGLLTTAEAEALQGQENGQDIQTAGPGVQADQNMGGPGQGAPREQGVRVAGIKGTDGIPATVYRGSRSGVTGAHTFEQLGNASGHPSSGLGVWFSSDATDAARYGKVGQHYLRITHPKVYDGGDFPAFDTLAAAIAHRKELQKQGYDGIVYDARDVGGPVQFVAFEPSQVVDAAKSYEQSGDTPRGRILFGKDGKKTIELLKGADLSTFHHETGHLFLSELVDDAFTQGASDQLRNDLDALLEHFGSKARVADGRNAVEKAIGNDQHEQFARGYEAYLFEGKAPSPKLADLFARFRTWMVSVYRSLRGLNVDLTDQVRGIYDRLLATDDEIAAATAEQGYSPLPDDVKSIVSPKDWENYQGMLRDAQAEARSDIDRQLLEARQRELQAWWKEKRAEIEPQVEAEAHQRPDFNAVSILSRGKLASGEEVPEALKGITLDRKTLFEEYGEDFVRNPRFPHVYRVKGGVSPDEAAMVLGYRDGGELMKAVLEAPDMRSWIKGETERRMREQYPDPMEDGTLPARALDAVHGTKRLASIERELEMLAKVAKEPAVPARALGAAARRRIASMKRRDIQPNSYLVAERKAARQATQEAAKGNYAKALMHKRQQAVSAHLYRAARDALEDFDKAKRYLDRFTRKDKRAKLGKAGGQYLDQIDGLLSAIELRYASGPEVERRQSFLDWVAGRAADGESIDVPDSILDTAKLTNIADMPMEQVRGLVDTVKQIDHLAMLKTKLMLGKELRDRREVDENMAASVRASHVAIPDRTGDRTTRDRVRKAVNQSLGAYLKPSTMTRDLDGFQDGGHVWNNTVGVMQDAVHQRLNPAIKASDEALAKIWSEHYSRPELRKMNKAIYRPQIGDSWSRGRILSLALNWGNPEGRAAILESARGRLNEKQVASLLQTLDARDASFVRAIWGHLETYWPEIAETQKRRTGLVPERVEASPFTILTSDGQTADMEGGYYPLKYEPDSSPKADLDEQTEFWDSIRSGRYAKAQTRHGHTIERVGSGGRTVRLDIGVLSQHIRDVLRDIHLGDAVNYVHKALHGNEFRSALTDTGKLEYGRALDLWLRDVATGEMAPRTFGERMARYIRQRFTMSILAFNAATGLSQVSGIMQSGVSLGWGAIGTGLKRTLTSPWTGDNSVWSYIENASTMMRHRSSQHQDEVSRIQRSMTGKSENPMHKYAWLMMTKMQYMVDAVTWLGAEAKGLKIHDGDVESARKFADDAVQRAQGSGEFVDKSALERGTFSENHRQSEFIRPFTVLMSYMIAKGNVAYERTRNTDFRDPVKIAKYTGNMVALFIIDQMILDFIHHRTPAQQDESDAGDWLQYLAGTAVENVMGSVPFVSQAFGSFRGYTQQTPSQSLFADLAVIPDTAKRFWSGQELTHTDRKNWVNLVGAVTGLPSSQINRTLDAVDAHDAGQDVPLYQYVTGLPPKKKN